MNITSDKIFVAGYETLSPEKIDIIIHNLTDPSLLYMSPELISIGLCKPCKSAVWSVGILFDEMIHRKHFFNNSQEICDPQCIVVVI